MRLAPRVVAAVGLLLVLSPSRATAQGTRPTPGRWVAIISNGYKGDSLRFTVPAGATQLTDVLFLGYWRCAGSIEQSRVGPPDAVPVRAGAFASTQTRPSWWWELKGRFLTATTAEGTYRQAAKSATCDTYVLRWKAHRVGS